MVSFTIMVYILYHYKFYTIINPSVLPAHETTKTNCNNILKYFFEELSDVIAIIYPSTSYSHPCDPFPHTRAFSEPVSFPDQSALVDKMKPSTLIFSPPHYLKTFVIALLFQNLLTSYFQLVLFPALLNTPLLNKYLQNPTWIQQIYDISDQYLNDHFYLRY